MSYPVQIVRPTPNPVSTSSQHTKAPVLEFLCLYTHDLRRKQKRWQDGRLKYHTWNKRIVVSDEGGYSVGGTHWCEDYDFGEGEEFRLDSGGVMVQVSECVETRDQDLSELIDKRLQEKAQRQSAAAARRNPATLESVAMPSALPSPARTAQPRHSHLHQLLGTPTGHHGRALVPSESPYEQRQKAASSPQNAETPPAKRRRREPSPPSKSGYAQSLFGAPLTLSGYPMSSAPTRQPLSRPATARNIDPTPSSSPGVDETAGSSPPRPIVQPPSSRQASSSVHARGPLLKSLNRSDGASDAPRASFQNRAPPGPTPLSSEQTDLRANAPAKQSQPVQQEAPVPTPLQPKSTNARCLSPDIVEIDPSEMNDRAKAAKNPHPVKPLRKAASTSRKSPEQRLPQSTTEVDPRSDDDREDRRSDKPRHSRQSTSVAAETASIRNLKESTIGPAAEEEPRTELRIKPRKKRGLLMLSDNGAKPSPTTQSSAGQSLTARKPRNGEKGSSYQKETPQTSGPAVHPRPAKDNLTETSNLDYHAGLSVNPRNDTDPAELVGGQCAVTQNVPVVDASVKKRSTAPKVARKTLMTANSSALGRIKSDTMERENSKSAPTEPPMTTTNSKSSVQDDSVFHHKSSPLEKDRLKRHSPEEPRQDARPARKKQKKSSNIPFLSSSDEDDNEPHDVAAESSDDELMPPVKAPPPRLAKLARKSIRSKEVIGSFDFFDDDEFEFPTQPSKSAQLVPVEPRNALPRKLAAAASTPRQSVPQSMPPAPPDSHPPASQKSEDDQHSAEPERPSTRLPSLQESLGKANPKSTASDSPAVEESTKGDAKPGSEKTSTVQQSAAISVPAQESTRDGHQEERQAATDRSLPAAQKRTIARSASDVLVEAGPLAASGPIRRTVSGLLQRATSATFIRSNSDLGTSETSMRGLDLVEPELPQPRKLVNPATRGRKAARPSDAAGQMPQCPLPADGFTTSRQIGVQSKKGKDKPLLPGFGKANGGPWSREAFDLFEFQRPG